MRCERLDAMYDIVRHNEVFVYGSLFSLKYDVSIIIIIVHRYTMLNTSRADNTERTDWENNLLSSNSRNVCSRRFVSRASCRRLRRYDYYISVPVIIMCDFASVLEGQAARRSSLSGLARESHSASAAVAVAAAGRKCVCLLFFRGRIK